MSLPAPAMPSAKIRMSGRSRIAFTMPAEETELPFTIDAILDACRRWRMRLNVNAIPDSPAARFGLSEFGVQDKSLASVVSSHSWAQATAELVEALGGEHQKSLADAARRRTTDVARDFVLEALDGQLDANSSNAGYEY